MNDHGQHVAPEAIRRLLGHSATPTRELRSAGRPGLVVTTQDGLVAVIRVRSRDGADARREFDALSRARSLGVPVPRPLAFTDDGTSLLAMEWIEHRTLPVASWTPDTGAQIGAALGRLHRATEDLPSWPDRHPFEEYLSAYSALECPTPDLARNVELLAATEPEPIAPRLIHGDFRPSNVIFREGGEPIIIDWEAARIGDPYIDLSTIIGSSRRPLPTDAQRALIETYERTARHTVDPDRLTWWSAFHRLSIRFQIHRLRV